MRPDNPRQQRNGERDYVLFAVSEEIPRARESAVEQRTVSEEMPLALASTSSRLCSITASIGSQIGTPGKGRSDLRILCYMFAANFDTIDLAFDRPCAQFLTGAIPLLGLARQHHVEFAIEG
jgi:hypothetical protein